MRRYQLNDEEELRLATYLRGLRSLAQEDPAWRQVYIKVQNMKKWHQLYYIEHMIRMASTGLDSGRQLVARTTQLQLTR